MLLAAVLILFLSIPVAGICASAFYFRFAYEGISRRLHVAGRLMDAGKIDKAREIISVH